VGKATPVPEGHWRGVPTVFAPRKIMVGTSLRAFAHPPSVIASAAKQSSVRKKVWIASSQVLLAMTRSGESANGCYKNS
jgi:hypothetical protein